jgi:hypothetical protein
MPSSDETLANICLENEMNHLKHTLETYVYSHHNMCNIPIYFATSRWNTCNIQMKHLKHLKHTLATWALLGRTEARRRGGRWRHMELVVRQRRRLLADQCGITRISSPLVCLLEHPSWKAAAASQLGGGGCGERAGRGGRGRLGPVENAARRRPQGMGHGAAATAGGETEWGGRMSTATRGNDAATIGVRGRDKWIG